MRAVRPEVRLLQKCAWMEAHQLRLAGCRGGREQSGAVGSWAAKMACRALCGMPLETNRRLQKARPSSSTAARLVVTHSSYMDGLIPLLDRFVVDPDAAPKIASVVPGRMYSCSGRSELFKMTVRVTNNGFKALARKGTAGQEVFISTTKMTLDDVKAALNRAAGFDLEKGGSRREHKAGGKR
ncbi:unnamed protein product [Ascophyllum nodosum]